MSQLFGISPLLIWAKLRSEVRKAKFCFGGCQVVFILDHTFLLHLRIAMIETILKNCKKPNQKNKVCLIF